MQSHIRRLVREGKNEVSGLSLSHTCRFTWMFAGLKFYCWEGQNYGFYWVEVAESYV